MKLIYPANVFQGEYKIWGWERTAVQNFLNKTIPSGKPDRIGTMAFGCGLSKNLLSSQVYIPGDANKGVVGLDTLVNMYTQDILGKLEGDLNFYVKFLFIGKVKDAPAPIWVGLQEGVDIEEVIVQLKHLQEIRKSYQSLSSIKDPSSTKSDYLRIVHDFCDRYLNRINIQQGNIDSLYLQSGVLHAAGDCLSIQIHAPASVAKKQDWMYHPKDEAWIYGIAVHSEGFLLIEPQQNSNDTLQLALRDLERPWNSEDFLKGLEILREMDSFLPRGDALLKYLHPDQYPPEKKKFQFEMKNIPFGSTPIPLDVLPLTLVVCEGNVHLDATGEAPRELTVGDWLLVPHAYQGSLHLKNLGNQSAKVLTVHP